MSDTQAEDGMAGAATPPNMFDPQSTQSRGWRVRESVFVKLVKEGVDPSRIVKAAGKVMPEAIDKSGSVLAKSLVARG